MRSAVCIFICACACLNAVCGWAGDRAVVATTDFLSSASLTALDLETNEATTNLLNIHTDAVLKIRSGKVYVINRWGGDNILVLDADDLTTPVLQFSVGKGSNPQDIAFVSDTKAYVSRFDLNRILIVNPSTGDSLGSVDISFAADADGLPEMTLITAYEGRAYVACQRLDRNAGFIWGMTDRSELVVVDMDTDEVVDIDAIQDGIQGIVLAAKNPIGAARKGGKLYLACQGASGDFTDGGLEVVDLANNTTEGLVLAESDLGGDARSVTLTGSTQGYVVLSDASFANSVKQVDLVSKQISDVFATVSGSTVPEMGYLNGRLYVLDRGTWEEPKSNLWVFDTSDNSLVAGPISTDVPPNAIVFLVEALESDLDGDGDVDFVDFLAFAGAFGSVPGTGNWVGQADLDGDESVDFDDFLTFAEAYGYRQ